MIARTVTMQLKPNTRLEFTKALEAKVLPLLRKQQGFKDELMFVVPDGKQALGISLWDTQEHAEMYARTAYPEVLKTLQSYVEGTPLVSNYEVAAIGDKMVTNK